MVSVTPEGLPAGSGFVGSTSPYSLTNGGKFKFERWADRKETDRDGHGHCASEILYYLKIGNGRGRCCFGLVFGLCTAMPSNGLEEDSRKVRKWKKQAKMQKYLRPGALAQLRDARINNTRAYCPAIGRKRILVMDFDGPRKINPTTTADEDDLPPRNKNKLKTPTTEQPQHPEVESRLESLPIDLLVRILCLLHHDELKSVFHVSQRIRKVAVMARQCYFNYTTPDRSRQEMLKLTTRRLDEQWPLLGGGGSDGAMAYPTTPKAPKHNGRPPLRLSAAEMRQISASLFQGSSSTSHRKKPKPPGLHRLALRSQPSSRVLFYEEELCQAVAQNTLR